MFGFNENENIMQLKLFIERVSCMAKHIELCEVKEEYHFYNSKISYEFEIYKVYSKFLRFTLE